MALTERLMITLMRSRPGLIMIRLIHQEHQTWNQGHHNNP